MLRLSDPLTMCSLTMQFENGVKDSCSENFVIFAEKCPCESLLEEITLCRVSISFERSAPPNIIS